LQLPATLLTARKTECTKTALLQWYRLCEGDS